MWLLLACQAPTSITGTPAIDSGVDSAVIGADTGDSADRVDTGESGAETGTTDSGIDTGAITVPPACPVFGEPVQTGWVADASLDEISGVAPSYKNPGVLWVIMDHGNAAEIYALDEFGSTLATIDVDGAENVDWEDIDLVACGAGTCLVVADTGDNERTRTDLALIVVEEPVLDGSTTEYTLPGQPYGFSWPNAGEDNEALTHTSDDRFVLVSKRTDSSAGVYTLPMFVDGAVATSLGQVVTLEAPPQVQEPIGAPVTSAALWPDDSLLLLRTYPGTISFSLPDGIDAIEKSTLSPVPAPPLSHDEAIAVDVVRDGYWTIPEADPEDGSPIWFVPCLRE